jgi:hypothetical protein
MLGFGFAVITRFRRHRVSRTRRTTVGAKVKVREGETVQRALRRLRNVIEQWYRYPLYWPKPTKKRLDYRQKPCEVRHQQRSLAKTCQRENRNLLLKELELGLR